MNVRMKFKARPKLGDVLYYKRVSASKKYTHVISSLCCMRLNCSSKQDNHGDESPGHIAISTGPDQRQQTPGTDHYFPAR